QGLFDLPLQRSESVTLRFSYVGYQTKTTRTISQDSVIDIQLNPTSEQLTEVVVQANSFRERFGSTNTSVESLAARQAEVLPALMGEVDIIKALQLKPG